jgi:hypothetical protein
MCIIILTNVALIPGFITNLVLLCLLDVKGVHWNSEYLQVLTRNRTTFCTLEQIDRHWVLENTGCIPSLRPIPSVFTTRKSQAFCKATFTGPQIHRILRHASLEVIAHLPAAVADNITIDTTTSVSTTIDCQTCSLSKATEIVS